MPSRFQPGRLLGRLTARQRSAAAEAALCEALHAHAGLILQAAARVLGSMTEAEDVAQDLAEKLLRDPPTAVDRWPALLKTMAVNAAIDRLRRRRDWSDLPAPDDGPDPESLLAAEQRARALRQAVAELPERDAALFSLHYLADLPPREIADQLDMSANAVSVALHRLRGRLAAGVSERLHPDPQGESS